MDTPSACVTVSYGQVSGAAKKWRYLQAALYVPHTTKDGRRVWVYQEHLGVARRSGKLAIEDARGYAARMGVPFVEGVRQYTPIAEG